MSFAVRRLNSHKKKKIKGRETDMNNTLRKKLIALISERYPYEADAIIDSLPDDMTNAEIMEQIEQIETE